MVVFNSYVKLPEGKTSSKSWFAHVRDTSAFSCLQLTPSSCNVAGQSKTPTFAIYFTSGWGPYNLGTAPVAAPMALVPHAPCPMAPVVSGRSFPLHPFVLPGVWLVVLMFVRQFGQHRRRQLTQLNAIQQADQRGNGACTCDVVLPVTWWMGGCV